MPDLVTLQYIMYVAKSQSFPLTDTLCQLRPQHASVRGRLTYQICSLTFFSSTSNVLILKSIPIIGTQKLVAIAS